MGYIGHLRERTCMPMLITALRDMQWRLRRFIIAAIGTFVCALGWNAKAHGYGD